MSDRRRGRRTLARDERGLSVALNYTLALAITAILISGLFVGMSTFLKDTRRTAVDSEFDVLGNRIASDVAAADRLAQASEGPAAVEVHTDIPATVGGVSYTVLITSSGVDVDGDGTDDHYDVTVYLDTGGLGLNESVSLRTAHEVEGQFGGGAYVIELDGASLEVERD